MVTKHQIGVALIALTLAGAWTLPARAAEEPAPAAETPAPAAEAPAPVAKPAEPVAKATKPRMVRHRVPARYWRHHPVRVATASWSWGGGQRWAVSHVVLGVGF